MTKKTSFDDAKKALTDEQWHVTQNNGTEAPFNNAYWDHHEPGIYVDIVSGEPLFSSTDNFSLLTTINFLFELIFINNYRLIELYRYHYLLPVNRLNQIVVFDSLHHSNSKMQNLKF